MRTEFRLSVLVVGIAFCAPLLAANRQMETGDTAIVACRVLEAHAGTHPAVVAVVFHQRDKVDQSRLASLLRQHSGENVQVQVGDETLADASVFRLKSCFGRGLLLLPAGGPPLKDGTTFVLKFSHGSDKN